MKKRIFGVLLFVVMLIGLLPATARAVNHISLVELTVATPQHGAVPEKPETSHDRVSVYAYEWKENGDNLSYGKTFEGGKTYTLVVRLATLDEFMESVSVKVNGRAAQVRSVDSNKTGLLLEIEFYVTPLGYTLSFDPGYGSGTMAPLTGKTSYILPACTFTFPAGKEFGYWLEEETNREYQPGENIILTKDTTVRAVWKESSGKTKIREIEATSNIASIPVLYGLLKTPDIRVTKGAPAYITDDGANLQWQKKVNGSWETQYSGRFTPGEWRVQTQIRIDGENAKQYELGNPVSLKVDGAQWTMQNNGTPSNHYDYSMIVVYSPAILIQDDPGIQPPKAITGVTLTVTGYKLGAKAQNAKITCDHEGVTVTGVQFVEWVDSDKDGNPDQERAAESFEAGKYYLAAYILKAKAGYDISQLTMKGVICSSLEGYGAYSIPEDCYKGMGALPVLTGCTVSFAAGGGKGTMARVTVEKGSYTLPENGFAPPEGKKFKAWSVGGKELLPGQKITLTGDMTLTALWEELPADHVCETEPVEKTEPTCTEDGKLAYFRCGECGKFYEDAAAQKEITDLTAWGKLEKLGHTDENGDGTCDVCGFMTDPAAEPETTDPTEPETAPSAAATVPATNPAPTSATDSKDTAPQDAIDLTWLWITLPVVVIMIAAVVVVVLKKKKSA